MEFFQSFFLVPWYVLDCWAWKKVSLPIFILNITNNNENKSYIARAQVKMCALMCVFNECMCFIKQVCVCVRASKLDMCIEYNLSCLASKICFCMIHLIYLTFLSFFSKIEYFEYKIYNYVHAVAYVSKSMQFSLKHLLFVK